jgi:hypothetical protein
VPALTLRRAELTKKISAAVSSSPSVSGSEASGSPVPRKRGRPTKAEMERRTREREEKEARGEVIDATPKRRGRKPMDPALKVVFAF